jgi:hypothetical protein
MKPNEINEDNAPKKPLPEDAYIRHIANLSATLAAHMEEGGSQTICVEPKTLLHLCEVYYQYKRTIESN